MTSSEGRRQPPLGAGVAIMGGSWLLAPSTSKCCLLGVRLEGEVLGVGDEAIQGSTGPQAPAGWQFEVGGKALK